MPSASFQSCKGGDMACVRGPLGASLYPHQKRWSFLGEPACGPVLLSQALCTFSQILWRESAADIEGHTKLEAFGPVKSYLSWLEMLAAQVSDGQLE